MGEAFVPERQGENLRPNMGACGTRFKRRVEPKRNQLARSARSA
jgi:hypothetical protein